MVRTAAKSRESKIDREGEREECEKERGGWGVTDTDDH